MIVTFHVVGGFAPVFQGCTLDTANMAPDDAKQLEALVATSGILSLKSARTPQLCDGRILTFDVESSAGSAHVTFDHVSLPDQLGPLLAFLSQRSGDLLPGPNGP